MPRDQQVQAIILDLKRITSRIVSKIALDVTANLIETTPVRTGWAASNWVPAIGIPQGVAVGTPESVSTAAQNQGIARVAASYNIDQGPVWVSNNVPYVPKLNLGTSKQAPAGFIEAAVVKAVTVDIQGLATS